MKFEVGDKVINTITKQAYTVVATDEAPYVTLEPANKSVDTSDGVYISVHQDFLELAS
jgi:hypothetical protein